MASNPRTSPWPVPDSLGLYVHLPFCRMRCTYCAFAVSTSHSMEDRYLAALEIETRLRADKSTIVDSIFFGGGTPSMTAPEKLAGTMKSLRSSFRIDPDAEFTLEANPEDVSAESLSSWKALGVNRLSIGVQSLVDSELRPLARLHGAERARNALALATESGIRTSADLILGLPGQTVNTFRESLRTVLGCGVGHVSLYMLDLEEGTTLHRQVLGGVTSLAGEDEIAEMYLSAIADTAAAGLQQYEISNFARPGQRCLHNLRYWQRRPYIGLGLGAHSFQGEMRVANTRVLSEYIDRLESGQLPVDFSETLRDEERRHERIFLALRQSEGLEYADLVELCGREGQRWRDRGIAEGWLQQAGDRVSLTSSGFLLSNEYISQLF